MHHRHGDQAIRSQALGVLDCLQYAAVDRADEHDDEVGVERSDVFLRGLEVLTHAGVVAVNQFEHDHQRGDDDGRNPCAVEELHGEHDSCNEEGSDRTDPVHGDVEPPPFLAMTEVVDAHSRLTEGETREHADGIEGDQCIDESAEGDQEDDCPEAEEDDAVGEHEAVAAIQQLPRQVAVSSDHRTQPREVGVCRVRRKDEDAEGGELGDEEEHVASAVHLLSQLGENRVLDQTFVILHGLELLGEDAETEEGDAEDDGHQDQRGSCVLRLGLLECRHPVGDGFHAGERDRAGREGLQEIEDRNRALHLEQFLGLAGVLDRRQVLEVHAIQADADEHDQRNDVEVGGRCEQRTRLL